MKIKVGDTKALGSNAIREACKTGRVLGGLYARGNVTIMQAGMFGSKTFINKEVLKQALLQNADYFEKEMDIIILRADPIVEDETKVEGDIDVNVKTFQKEEVFIMSPEKINEMKPGDLKFKTKQVSDYSASEKELEDLEKELLIE